MIQLEGKTNFQEYAMIKSNRPKSLDDLLKKGEALVSKCSSIRRWNLYKKRKYEKRLRNMDSSLRDLSAVLQVGQALDTQRLQRIIQDMYH
ncbi:hypothetical protein WN944_014305 [Citrus x changshan-huyou]|uniref:RPW8 domain-containing protein n=1 Tax=Citrus x changshan-huyou TaxID=2935761 RepID=A0AAP0M5G1_9ROSI